jgi:hypothetical protein
MTTKQMLRTLRVAPFQPFVIHMVNGRSLEVRHPELVTFEGGGRIALVRVAEDCIEAVDILMIVSLRPKVQDV